jgi:hypothetical protein
MEYLLTICSSAWVRLVCLVRGHAMQHRATYFFALTTVTSEQCTRCGYQTSDHNIRKAVTNA